MSVNEDPSTWRLRTPGGIPFKLKENSGTFERENATTIHIVIIESSSLAAFVVEAFPLPVSFLGTILYPRSPHAAGLPSLTVKGLSFKSLNDGLPVDPFGGDSDAPDGTYDSFVEVTLEFATDPQNDQERDPNDPFTFLEISADASGTFLSVTTSGQSEWVDQAGGTEVVVEPNIPVTITEAETEWTVSWPQVPFNFVTGILMNRLRAALGSVNSTVMPILYNAPVDTVLFLGFSLRQEFTWREGFAGQSPVNVEMKFLEKNVTDNDGNAITHNHLYRPGVGYRRLRIDRVDNPHFLYESTDLNFIFSP